MMRTSSTWIRFYQNSFVY